MAPPACSLPSNLLRLLLVQLFGVSLGPPQALLFAVPLCLQVSLPQTSACPLEQTPLSTSQHCSFPPPPCHTPKPQHAPQGPSPKHAPWHCSRQLMHLGQKHVLSHSKRSPKSSAGHSGLPQRGRSMFMEGAAEPGHPKTSAPVTIGSTQGVISLPESLLLGHDTAQVISPTGIRLGASHWVVCSHCGSPYAHCPILVYRA